ncbi:MAG TPA: hypothetical protein VF552_06815 [Allosphingosinicella sp.]|jgi:hypothetical protein
MAIEDVGIAGVKVQRVSRLPDSLDGTVRVGPHSMARPGTLLRILSGVGRFAAQGGTSIDYCPEKEADPAAVEAVLKGSVLGAIIHQRGELPLHATTLVEPGGAFAVALAGHSGAGKSTTAYALASRGWTLLADDLTRVTFVEGAPIAWPGRSRLRLMEDACLRFRLDPARLDEAPNWPGKYVVDLKGADRAVALAAVVALERGEGPLEVQALRGAAAARTLTEQTYRLHYVAALGQSRRHFETIAMTATRAQILRVRGRAPVEEVAAAINRTLSVDLHGRP